MSIYDFEVEDPYGEEVALSEAVGAVMILDDLTKQLINDAQQGIMYPYKKILLIFQQTNFFG